MIDRRLDTHLVVGGNAPADEVLDEGLGTEFVVCSVAEVVDEVLEILRLCEGQDGVQLHLLSQLFVLCVVQQPQHPAHRVRHPALRSQSRLRWSFAARVARVADVVLNVLGHSLDSLLSCWSCVGPLLLVARVVGRVVLLIALLIVVLC